MVEANSVATPQHCVEKNNIALFVPQRYLHLLFKAPGFSLEGSRVSGASDRVFRGGCRLSDPLIVFFVFVILGICDVVFLLF